MNGWIKIHRSLADHWLFSFDDPDKGLAWIDLLLMARHDDGEILLKNRVQKVKRGQIAMSQIGLQKRWKWSQNKVKRFLKLLKNERMADFETNDLTTIITICNYNTFQDIDYEGERPNERAHERPVERTTNDQSNDDIRRKEGKEGKNITPLPPKGVKFEIPDSINRQAWEEFEQHRKLIRKPLNDLSRKKAINVLKPLSFEDQQRTVDQTIQSRWTGLFPKKENAKNQQNSKDGSRSNHGPVTIDHKDTSWDIAEY